MNLHPATVHFPIALLVASFMFDLIGVVSKEDSFRKAGLYCLLLGFIGAGAAYWTGVLSEESVSEIPHISDALEGHKIAGVITLVMFGVLVIGRIILEGRPRIRRIGYVVYLLVALIAVVNVLRTGYLGSELVQKYGAGVEPVMRKLELKQQEAPEGQVPAYEVIEREDGPIEPKPETSE